MVHRRFENSQWILDLTTGLYEFLKMHGFMFRYIFKDFIGKIENAKGQLESGIFFLFDSIHR
jgi:hypothetical protein